MKESGTSQEVGARSRRRFLSTSAAAGVGLAAGSMMGPCAAGASAATDWINVVRDFGAVGDNTGNEATALQNAIDAAAGLGTGNFKGGLVWFPPGWYKTGTLNLRSGVTLAGAGPASQLRLKTGVDGPLVRIRENADGSPASNTMIRDLALLGPGAHTPNRHGIAIESNGSGSTPLTGSDAYHRLENLFILYFGGHGIAIELDPPGGTADVRGTELLRIMVRDCGKADASRQTAGIWIKGSDTSILGCTSSGNEGPGFEIQGGGNSWVSACKAFFNENEFKIAGNRIQLSNCQAQDGFGDGFQLQGAGNVSMSDCQADSNGKAGFRFDSVTFSSFSGLTSFVRPGFSSNGPGYAFTSTSKCFISGIAEGFATPVVGTPASSVSQIVS